MSGTGRERRKKDVMSSTTRGGHGRSHRPELGPYLEQLRALAAESGAQGGMRLPIGSRDLELGDWERSALDELAAATDAAPARWTSLVAEGLAFQVKLLVEMETLDLTDALDRERIIGELSQNAVIGLSLIEAAQQEINLNLRAGEMKLAKQLTAFRNKISADLNEIVDRIGKDAFDEARGAPAPRPAATPDERPEDDRSSGQRPAAQAPGRGERGRRSATATTPRRRSRSAAGRRAAVPKRSGGLKRALLVLALAAPLIPAVLLVLPRGGQPAAETRGVSLATFKHLDEVVEVSVDRSSLFVRLDTRAWSALAPYERYGLAKKIVGVAESSGYKGVLLSTTQGRHVGQWLKDGGITLSGGAPGQPGAAPR